MPRTKVLQLASLPFLLCSEITFIVAALDPMSFLADG